MKCSNFFKMCQSIKEQERRELIQAIKAHGGRYCFTRDEEPCVIVNPKYGGPADYLITEVTYDENRGLFMQGIRCEDVGGGVYYDSEDEICVYDIAAGHIEYIIHAIPATDEIDSAIIKPLEEYPCVVLSREDFHVMGYDASDIPDNKMGYVADKIGSALVSEYYWDHIVEWGERMEMPRITKSEQ